uniref:Uncharacterized protein n=1 Tax=Sphaerodactylus townsendi TaxID=933632 RepID=A0ACB8FFQ8_9SAUR
MYARWSRSKASMQAPPVDFSFRGISFVQVGEHHGLGFCWIAREDIYWIETSPFQRPPTIDPVLIAMATAFTASTSMGTASTQLGRSRQTGRPPPTSQPQLPAETPIEEERATGTSSSPLCPT